MSSEPPARAASSADDEEQRRDDDAVVDHLQHRALGALRREREDADRDEAELRDRGVADDQAGVGLRERHRRAVEDRRQPDQQHQRLEVHAGVGQHRQHDRRGSRRRRPSRARR